MWDSRESSLRKRRVADLPKNKPDRENGSVHFRNRPVFLLPVLWKKRHYLKAVSFVRFHDHPSQVVEIMHTQHKNSLAILITG